jgi:hypothetical protein
VRLFRRAPGYLDTTLYNDRDDSERCFTIDRWVSEEAYRRFRIEFADEFERLDGLGEKLTQEEIKLGEFRYRDLSNSG